MNDIGPGALSAEVTGTLHAIVGRLEAALEPLGLSLAKFGVLSKLVAAEEPLPLRLLAEQCACVRSNITQLVDRLEADKLVRRADDPEGPALDPRRADRRGPRAACRRPARARDGGKGAVRPAPRAPAQEPGRDAAVPAGLRVDVFLRIIVQG